MAGPTSPPIRLSGADAGLLVGPSEAPVGAIVATPGVANNLQDITQANPAGSTFYLPAGTHINNPGTFGQVEPKAGNTYIFGAGAILSGEGTNNVAFSGANQNVTIRYGDIRNFRANRDQCVVNTNFQTGWTIDRCKVWLNTGGSVALGSNNAMTYCLLTQNSQYGWQAAGPPGGTGAANITVDRCEVSYNGFDDWERRVYGCGCTGACKYWFVENAFITNCWVHGNAGPSALWGDTNNVGILVENNYVSDNYGFGFMWEISYNFRVANNTFARNTWGVGRDFNARGETTFGIGAIYISEAGGEPSLFGGVYGDSPIEDNTFIDNYGGVVGYENGDRFGHDDTANTSKGYTTLMVPGGDECFGPGVPPGGCPAMNTYCSDPATGGLINQEPYTTDCRWKTKNLKVRRNVFELIPERIGLDPAVLLNLGRHGVFSDGATVPSWSPYLGSATQNGITANKVQLDITFNQGNAWSDNTYVGYHRWLAVHRSSTRTWDAWRGSPFNQDAGSTYTP